MSKRDARLAEMIAHAPNDIAFLAWLLADQEERIKELEATIEAKREMITAYERYVEALPDV